MIRCDVFKIQILGTKDFQRGAEGFPVSHRAAEPPLGQEWGSSVITMRKLKLATFPQITQTENPLMQLRQPRQQCGLRIVPDSRQNIANSEEKKVRAGSVPSPGRCAVRAWLRAPEIWQNGGSAP